MTARLRCLVSSRLLALSESVSLMGMDQVDGVVMFLWHGDGGVKFESDRGVIFGTERGRDAHKEDAASPKRSRPNPGARLRAPDVGGDERTGGHALDALCNGSGTPGAAGRRAAPVAPRLTSAAIRVRVATCR